MTLNGLPTLAIDVRNVIGFVNEIETLHA